jgi:hypothetical protein
LGFSGRLRAVSGQLVEDLLGVRVVEEDDPPSAGELVVLDEPDETLPFQVVQGPLDGAEAQAGGGSEGLVGWKAIGLAPGEVEQEDLEQEPAGGLEAGPVEQVAFKGAARRPLERLLVDRPGPRGRTAIGSGIDPGSAAS